MARPVWPSLDRQVNTASKVTTAPFATGKITTNVQDRVKTLVGYVSLFVLAELIVVVCPRVDQRDEALGCRREIERLTVALPRPSRSV